MKRSRWPGDESEEEIRPPPACRSRETEPAEQFDLNATPRGFDLNAPFSEEDYAQSSEWVEEKTASDNVQKEEGTLQQGILKQSLESAASLGIDEDLDLLHNLWNSQHDAQRLDDVLANLCEDIGKHPSGPPKYQYLSCLYFSKKLPTAFSLPRTYQVLLSFLDPNGPGSFSKKQNSLPVFASKLLFRAFSEETQWPLDFVKLYLDDAVNGRIWVDNDYCKEFVLNVLTAFREDGQDLGLGDDLQASGPDNLPGHAAKAVAGANDQVVTVKNRYPNEDLRQKAREDFIQALNQLLKAPAVKESPRILQRFIMLGIYYEEVRVLASGMLESWLNNPVHFRAAKLVLDRLIHHTHTTSAQDLETVTNLLACKLSAQGVGQIKTSVSNIYTDIVFQIVQRRPEYSAHALKTFLTGEVLSKGSQNIKGISVVLKALPDSQSPERELASAIKDVFVKDEPVPHLHDALGRLTKQQVNPFLLCRALFEPWAPIQAREDAAKEAWLKKVVDLACKLLMQAALTFSSDESFILSISKAGQHEPPNKDKMAQLEAFSMKVMTFQVEALTWCTEVLSALVPQMTPPQFACLVRKLQFLEPMQEYSLSSYSSDTELNSFQVVAYCMHASEEILARVILMGISNQFPLSQRDALSTIESLVWRAAASKHQVHGTLFADNNQLPAAIMKLSSFNYPNSVQQQPLPQIVVKDMFWKSCLVILAISVYNPNTIGRSVWENSPPLRFLLQCLATESKTLSQDESNHKEVAQNDIEAEEVVKAVLTEHNPLEEWKGNVALLNHGNYTVKPPSYVIEELAEIDQVYHLGRRLRACKSPNFLSETVSALEFGHAWTWVKRVVAKEPEIIGMLPFNWQCELLYMQERSKSRSPEVLAQMQELRATIFKMIEEHSNPEEVEGVIKFLAQKLASPCFATRSAARNCISGILSPANTRTTMEATSPDCSWLYVIGKLKATAAISKIIVTALQDSLLNESSLQVIHSYLVFLSNNLSSSSFCRSISRVLVQRKVLCISLLPMPIHETSKDGLQVADLALEAFNKALQDDASEWEGPDSSRVYVTRNRSIPDVVLEGMVEIILFAASQDGDSWKKKPSYLYLLEVLFPPDGRSEPDEQPKLASFLSEPQAVRLARTRDPRLVSVGLSLLGLERKVQLLAEMGLPVEARSSLLEQLNAITDASRLTSLSSSQIRLSRCSTTTITLEASREILCSKDTEMQWSASDESLSKSADSETVDDSNTTASDSREDCFSFRVLFKKLLAGGAGNNMDQMRRFLNAICSEAEAKILLSMIPVLASISEAGGSFFKVASTMLRNISGAETGLENRMAGKLEDPGSGKWVSEDGPTTKLELSLQKQLLQRLEDYLKQGKDVVSGSSILGAISQDIVAKLKDDASIVTVDEVAETYEILVTVVSLLDPNLVSREYFQPLISTIFSPVGKAAILLVDHVVYKSRSRMAVFAERTWDMVLDEFSTKEFDRIFNEESCLAATVLFEFLQRRNDAADIKLVASASRVLTILAVFSCAMPMNRNACVSTASTVLLRAFSSRDVMQSVLEQLAYMNQHAFSGDNVQVRSASAELLCAFYFAYPVSILESMPAGTCLPAPSDIFQASSFYPVARHAVLSALSDSGKAGATAFCYYLARKHPVLLIPHFGTIKLIVQENFLMINGGRPEQRTSVARMLAFSIELLDALRPCILYSPNSAAAYPGVESLLNLFLQILQSLESSDQLHFGKFVKQLVEFLFHCTSAGGGFSQLVQSHSEEVLRPASVKFGKARKLSQLLQLLDKGSSIPSSSKGAIEELAEVSAEKIERVRKILLYFSDLQRNSVREAWDITGAVKSEASMVDVNLLSTLIDLERASTHVPGLLSGMEDCLTGLMRLENADARERAYSLAARSLQYGSCKAQPFAFEILEQIKSPGTKQQIETLTRHIGKLFFYFGEYQKDILMELFHGTKAMSGCLNQLLTEALSLS